MRPPGLADDAMPGRGGSLTSCSDGVCALYRVRDHARPRFPTRRR